MDQESAQLMEILVRNAVERVAMLGGLKLDEYKRAKLEEEERARIRIEAKEWPLARCVAVIPWIDSGYNDQGSYLREDGHLSFYLAFAWQAPFPAEHVRVDFRCHMAAPNNPASGNRDIAYYVRDYRITNNGTPEQLRGVFKVRFELDPAAPVTIADLGPNSDAGRTRMGRDVLIKGMRLTANGPWPPVTDSVDLPDMGFWIPRL